MSGAEILRRASQSIRHDLEFGSEFGDEKFLTAVANWLDAAVVDAERQLEVVRAIEGDDVPLSSITPDRQALAVARAYTEATR